MEVWPLDLQVTVEHVLMVCLKTGWIHLIGFTGLLSSSRHLNGLFKEGIMEVDKLQKKKKKNTLQMTNTNNDANIFSSFCFKFRTLLNHITYASHG